MKSLRTNLIIIFLAAFSIVFAGCVPPEGNVSTNANSAANSNQVETNTNTAEPPANEEFSTSMPVTLPVLDAMFTDPQFADELKTKLQVTDEQIEQLRRVSSEAVQNLSEEEPEDYSGSTRAAVERATSEMRQILGEEKSKKLFELVRNRWANKDGSVDMPSVSAKPNAVPEDTRVVVNAPAYRMDIFQDGKLIKTYKIGIGYPEFPLPSGLRRAETIIFNPTWTPPDEPWVKGKFKPGKTVEAGSKDNPLGIVKIPIGLPSLIHGGKSPARLGSFASHGCVGLTNDQVKDFSLELARISGTRLDAGAIAGYGKERSQTKEVKLSSPVLVELRYETIVVEDGALKIYRDVYERGTNTEENLRRVLETHGVSLESLSPQDRENILKGLREMAADAKGDPVESDGNTNAGTNANGNSNAADNKNKSASGTGSVTKNIKGKKEIVFQLAELKGKGFPAPVNPQGA